MNLKYFSPCLEEATLVVLLAVLAVVEGLHHLGVLGGGEQLQLLGHLLAVSGISDKSSHLADDPLDALLGLEHGHVHVLHPLQHVGGGRGLVSGGTLLAAGLGSVNIHVDHGGEEEGEGGEGGAGVSHGWLVRCAVCNCGAVRLCLYLFVFNVSISCRSESSNI